MRKQQGSARLELSFCYLPRSETLPTLWVMERARGVAIPREHLCSVPQVQYFKPAQPNPLVSAIDKIHKVFTFLLPPSVRPWGAESRADLQRKDGETESRAPGQAACGRGR